MKNGEALPPALAEALEGDAYAREVFLAMRPSCQKKYTERVAHIEDNAVLQKRLANVLNAIRAYGRRHGAAE
jgi:uncharacterized protein YdeI (YjbR/CyaY-like superfamily)